jgi:hypothetical protein
MNYAGATTRGDASDVNNGLKRRTLVIFSFDSTPDRKIIIQAVSGDLPKDSVKCIQSLPNGKIDITLRNEGLARALIANGIRLNGTKVKPQPVGFRTTFVYVHYLPSELFTDFVAKEMSKYGKVIDI